MSSSGGAGGDKEPDENNNNDMAATKDQNLLLGMLLGFLVQWKTLEKCLYECSTWIDFVEKVATYLIITFGFARPRIIMFRIFRVILGKLSEKITGSPLVLNDEIERAMQVSISLASQYELTSLWYMAKESAVCLQHNDCNADFFLYIIYTKYWLCGYNSVDYPTNCDIVFNKSMIILAAILAVVLFSFSIYVNDEQNELCLKLDEIDWLKQVENEPPEKPEIPPLTDPNASKKPEIPLPTDPNVPKANLQTVETFCPHCKKEKVILYNNPHAIDCDDCK